MRLINKHHVHLKNSSIVFLKLCYEKAITGGAFGFEDRLTIFLFDNTKHSPVFEEYIRKSGCELTKRGAWFK